CETATCQTRQNVSPARVWGHDSSPQSGVLVEPLYFLRTGRRIGWVFRPDGNVDAHFLSCFFLGRGSGRALSVVRPSSPRSRIPPWGAVRNVWSVPACAGSAARFLSCHGSAFTSYSSSAGRLW